MHLGTSIPTRLQSDELDSKGFGKYVDPLDPDSSNDVPIVVTRRQLIRLAVVATEVGARFQRDAIGHDSMAWMLAPRRLFDGRDAVDAALEQTHCVRALILHGLCLGLDARPQDIDELQADQTCRKRPSGEKVIGKQRQRRGRGVEPVRQHAFASE